MINEVTTIAKVNKYLSTQANLDTLRFITCGSVDDGKSTLIGRILFEAQLIFKDQIENLKKESIKFGTQGDEIDFSLLVDGLSSEREQGITIDVAYRYFSTENRKFIVADTPGHEQYTCNMVTGASTADVAVILIDARKGVLEQTRRHSMICSALGIKNIVVAINKMDLVSYQEETYKIILEKYKMFAKTLNFEVTTFIPLSALKGDNIIKSSKHLKWYKGPTLLGFLETVDKHNPKNENSLRFPVQWVNRPNSDFRGFSGNIEAGTASIGQNVKIMPSGQTALIHRIIFFKSNLKKAILGQAVTLTLDREIDVSRGDIIVDASSPCKVSHHFEVTVIWFDQEPGYLGRTLWLKLGTTTVSANITSIKYKININTFEHISAKQLEQNDISVVNIKTDRPVPFEAYQDCPNLGAFILIDRFNNNTIAAGMIRFSLHRSHNIHIQDLDIDKDARRYMNGHTSKVIWFTGLSGSGKSTIANALEKKLHREGFRTYILDGDNIRHGLNNDLGFKDADRIENIRRVGEVTKLMVDAGIIVLAAFISPFRAEREMVRNLFEDGEFFEIYVDTPLELAESRDPKGLYKKARLGNIPNFTGIDSPYEIPIKPEMKVTTANKSVEQIVKEIIKILNLSLK